MIEISVNTILGMVPLMGGHREQIIEIEQNSNVLDLIDKLIFIYGKDLKNRLIYETKEVKPGIAIFINGRNVFALEGLNTKLSLGDEVLIFPPVGGG